MLGGSELESKRLTLMPDGCMITKTKVEYGWVVALLVLLVAALLPTCFVH